ncbi:MAG TPA: glycosyl transferase family 1 [Hungateiclostridium thermocellum]|uniref:Glycosyl transferase group 1 n=2 Tax=Acetivibrio thermocellus TaxID=1515 RepID=A3DHW2_ACET2|nr:glycosyltransferase family 4 protein [Acetivibrio thermocellus]CDG36862.1 group 1 glycosyl transferase [Acetivibrio thermocellus BC1]ABN53541.1 glycosyl transferase group 1 [Acetivibrio thermocellus ATCC 27405]ADU75980.1 glycosyl transferase group 1 [Acetivibrio thermocellus DSM 1313]ALX10015.1 glycosyl transferase group 1 [Acetivibrio thermocellus AD2]ANV77789.1 glycosyl transferase group 1 [Acetivibrio thermocellus DSM 2360]
MLKVGICGHFGGNHNFLDGQTIKVKSLTEAIKDNIGEHNVLCVDTYNWKKRPIRLLRKCFRLARKCKNIVILPAQNGIKVLVPLFSLINKLFGRKLFYVVIGGWLPTFLKNYKWLVSWLHHMDGIFVETASMSEKLIEFGLKNVLVMPNFRQLRIVDINELQDTHALPYKLCTFSRVLKEKGIEDAINAVIKVNTDCGREVCTLDIYGQIDEKYKDAFWAIMSNVPAYIKYKGEAPYEKAVDVLKDYYLMLFPTYYEGEGFAGTIIDAFASGLPVIASDWRYNSEIVQDYKTGRIFRTKDIKELAEIILYCLEHGDEVMEMKKNCIEEARKYTSGNAIKKLIEVLDN